MTTHLKQKWITISEPTQSQAVVVAECWSYQGHIYYLVTSQALVSMTGVPKMRISVDDQYKVYFLILRINTNACEPHAMSL